MSFGVNSSRYDNPLIPVRQRKVTRFDFNQQINLNLVGQIGTKLKLGVSYNTQAAFEFDNVSTNNGQTNKTEIKVEEMIGARATISIAKSF